MSVCFYLRVVWMCHYEHRRVSVSVQRGTCKDPTKLGGQCVLLRNVDGCVAYIRAYTSLC